jgi:alpha-glucosidase (family GH31 glycosyl hydrolase)
MKPYIRDGARWWRHWSARAHAMLIYINPFLSNEPGHNALFTEAQRLGYLVRRQDDSPYLIKNTNFWAGMLDLSNPQARTWIKEVIKKELIGKAGASGWTADFGEALPFDSKLSGGADPGLWHNRYAEEWARVNREAIEEAGRGSDITFFSRSGFAKSPGISTLFWLGDQLQTWDEYDGIKSAVVGVLSGGISGFSLLHTDAGGYGALSVPYEGKKIPVIARSPELLMRWFELNAFTAVFRTHERPRSGNIGTIRYKFRNHGSPGAMRADLSRTGRLPEARGERSCSAGIPGGPSSVPALPGGPKYLSASLPVYAWPRHDGCSRGG